MQSRTVVALMYDCVQAVVTGVSFLLVGGIAIVAVWRRQLIIAHDSKNWQIWNAVPPKSSSTSQNL